MIPKHTDVCFGFVMTAVTWTVSHFNEIVGACIGVTSLAVMIIRLRREWKHRND